MDPEHIYTDHGLTGRTRARPGFDQTLAAVRCGDTLVVTKLDRLARSVTDVVSGKRFDRPGLAELIDHARPGDRLCATRLDR